MGGMVRFAPALFCALCACMPDIGPGPGCEDGVVAESCDDTFCGEPTLVLADAASLGEGGIAFTHLEDGDPVQVHYGSQGGFHISGGVETTNLCSVLYLDFKLEVAADATSERVTIVEDQQHVQSLRCSRLVEDGAPGVTADDCDEVPSFQRWWNTGRMLTLPCDHRPIYEGGFVLCENPPVQPIDEHPAWLTITVRDHDDRTVTTTVEIDPTFTPPE